jgi:hypothetical protein
MTDQRDREIETVGLMIGIYCRRHHRRPCSDCEDLLRYAAQRVTKCAFGPDKPVCSRCPVHCYKPEMRRRIQEVMRYAGPRMLYRHPLHALRHFIRKHNRP